MTDERPHSAVFVIAVILLDSMSFGLAMPVLPRLLMHVGRIDLPRAIELASWIGLMMALATFVAAPVIGNLSDRFGRRPVLLFALAGLSVDYLLLAVANTLPLIFLGRAVSGLFGGSYGAAQAAIADVTPPDQRAKMFGRVGAAFGVGFIVGPAIGGLLGEMGERAPFYAAAALSAANMIYGLTLFPETLAPERRRAFDWRRANPLGALGAARAIPGMIAVAMVLAAWQVASLVYPLTWSFFTIARLGWSNAMIGASLTAVGVVMVVSQGVVTGPVVKRLGERDAATLGLCSAIVGFIGYAFVTKSWMVFAVMAPIALQMLVQPSLMAMMSKRATPETQGEVQGIAAMAMGLGSLAAPLLLTRTMAWFSGGGAPVYFPGAAFIVSAVFAGVALVLLRRLPPAQTSVSTASATASP